MEDIPSAPDKLELEAKSPWDVMVSVDQRTCEMAENEKIEGLPGSLRLYIALVGVAGAATLATLAQAVEWGPTRLWETGLFTLLVVMAGCFPIPVGPRVRTDVTAAVLFGAALLLEPGQAALAGAVGIVAYTLVIRYWGVKLRLQWYKYPFNGATTALFVGAASAVFHALAEGDGLLTAAVIPAAVTYYMVNTALISGAAGLQLGLNPARFWWMGTKENGLAELSLYAFGFLGAVAYRESPWTIMICSQKPLASLGQGGDNVIKGRGRCAWPREGRMFRIRDPQESLWQSQFLVTPKKAKRLERSWAEVFRNEALPLIDEERFAPMYCVDNGRPNRAVQTVLGVHLLKEMFNLTDDEALEQLEFNLLWHHALRLDIEETHLPQKTLHNFRVRLMQHDGGRLAFQETTDRIIQALGIRTGKQRLDSTHIMSNIATLTRLGLFCETMRLFLRALRWEHPELRPGVPEGLLGRYLKEEDEATHYEDARTGEGRRRLSVCARDLYRLVDRFHGTTAAQLEEYRLREQCHVGKHQDGRPRDDDDDAGECKVPVALKDPKQVSADSLQSPHDPDVTYSGHKGKGYEVQVAETCHEENATQLITHVEVTPSSGSDTDVSVPVVDGLAERKVRPDELFADTAYGSGRNAFEASRRGTELVSPVAGSAPGNSHEGEGDGPPPRTFRSTSQGSRPRCAPPATRPSRSTS